MTLDTFCRKHKVTRAEREELEAYLLWVRVKPAMMQAVRMEVVRWYGIDKCH